MTMWPFKKRKTEKRSQSYTELAMQARADYITRGGIGDLTGTVQAAVSLWEQGLSMASTDSRLLSPHVLALTARSLALTGESVWLLDDPLTPVASYDLTTRDGKPTAYRVTVPDVGGGHSETRLAGEVLHFRIGVDESAPWAGSSPLRRASLSAGMLHAVEQALAGVYANAPMGSSIVPMPENTTADQSRMEASFRGKHGRVLLPESTNVQAAGGPTPNSDWRPQDLTPDLQRSEAVNAWRDARHSIQTVYGVLPSLFNVNATGPVIREAQRHLAQWTLQPVANMIGHEVATKTLTRATLDVAAPLHAFDAGGRARALKGVVSALAEAQQNNIDPAQVSAVAQFVGVETE